MPFRKKRRKKD